MAEIEFLYDDRVALTPVAEAHLPLLTRWINDPAVLHYLGMLGGVSEDRERGWIERVSKSSSDKVFGILLRAEQRLIGTLALHNVQNPEGHAEFGISIGEKDCWGQGYGTEAARLLLDWGFNRLALRSIFLRVSEFNARGMRSYAKLGFKPAGRLRRHSFRNGTQSDMLYMDLLPEEFNTLWAEWRKSQALRYGMPEPVEKSVSAGVDGR
jgi:RimJ/RimL family protein N-acetyltransferase